MRQSELRVLRYLPTNLAAREIARGCGEWTDPRVGERGLAGSCPPLTGRGSEGVPRSAVAAPLVTVVGPFHPGGLHDGVGVVLGEHGCTGESLWPGLTVGRGLCERLLGDVVRHRVDPVLCSDQLLFPAQAPSEAHQRLGVAHLPEGLIGERPQVVPVLAHDLDVLTGAPAGDVTTDERLEVIRE